MLTNLMHASATAPRQLLLRRTRGVALVLTVVVAACGSSSTVDLASLGLAIEANIQAGSRFEVAVPVQPDTTIEVAMAPPGVTASITDSAGGASILLSVAVDAATPRGAYNLALQVERADERYELGWPFEVVEPIGASSPTLPGEGEALLTVESPRPGDLFETGAVISGRTSSLTVLYRLSSGELVLAEGAAPVADGTFEAIVDFENTCCIEMLLEVYHPDSDDLAVTIPVAYPESG